MKPIKYKKYKNSLSAKETKVIGEIFLLAGRAEQFAVELTKTEFFSRSESIPAEYGIQREKVFKALNGILRDFEKNSRLHKLTNWRKPIQDLSVLLDQRDIIAHGIFQKGAVGTWEFVSAKNGHGIVADLQTLINLKESLERSTNMLLMMRAVIERSDLDVGPWAVQKSLQNASKRIKPN